MIGVQIGRLSGAPSDTIPVAVTCLDFFVARAHHNLRKETTMALLRRLYVSAAAFAMAAAARAAELDLDRHQS
jgi:hypothetical protein